MNATEQNGRWSIGSWVVAGFIAGAAIPCASIWPEFAKRLHWAWSGGGGESSDWGEPLFYMVIMGVPAGLIGGVAALAIGLLANAVLFGAARWQQPKGKAITIVAVLLLLLAVFVAVALFIAESARMGAPTESGDLPGGVITPPAR